MVLLIVLTIEVLLLVEMKRRIKILTAVDCICVYVMLYQYFYYFADFYGYKTNDSGLMGSFYYMAEQGVLLYFYIFLIAYGSSLGLTAKNDGASREALIDTIRKSLKYQKWFIIAFYAIILVYLASVNYDTLFYNERYLLLRRPESLNHANALTAQTLPLLDAIGIASAFFFAVNLFLKRYRSAMVLAPLFLWGVIYALANSSRVSVVLMLVPSIIAWIVLRRGRVPTALGFLVVGVYFLDCALNGRYATKFGLSQIPSILVLPFTSEQSNFMDLVFNLLQGIYTTMDGFLVPGENPEIYKTLSFSLLPSFIDGFADIQMAGMLMLGPAIPMSAITEVIRFGPVHTAIGAVFLFMLLRQSIKSATSSPLLYVFTLPLVMMLFVQANAYPLRLVFRQAVYAYLFMVIAARFAKKRRGLTQEAIAEAPLINRVRQQAGLGPVGRRPSLPQGRLR